MYFFYAINLMVITMKKFVILIVSAILVGSLFAIYMFRNIEQGIAKTTKENTATAFQVGVYRSIENAQNATQNLESSLIYQDNEYYRIFMAIYHDESIIELMKNYFQNQNIYLKEISVSEDFLTKLAKYESIIKKSNLNSYKEVNQNILDEFERSNK